MVAWRMLPAVQAGRQCPVEGHPRAAGGVQVRFLGAWFWQPLPGRQAIMPSLMAMPSLMVIRVPPEG